MKPGQISALERLYKRRFPSDSSYTAEQARELALLSRAIGRQIGLLIDRKGKVFLVISGQSSSIFIPELPQVPQKSHRLRGLRLLHTHLGKELLSQEDLMDLLFLRLDAMQAITVNEDGEPENLQTAWLLPPRQSEDRNSREAYHIDSPKIWHNAQYDFEAIRNAFEKNSGQDLKNSESGGERAFLVSVSTQSQIIQEHNLDELEKLAETAGLMPSGRLCQRVRDINPGFIMGRGKLAELEVEALRAGADVLIFDGELSPSQLNNLADLTERKVLDRTQLILDIFAQHAVSREGKLQVELAQLAYSLPRLTGKNRALDRLMGGIGGRGPGESRLEMDRRKSRERVAFLKKELEKLRSQRSLVRNRRIRNGIPVAALIGYTNAGKSTLLNTLTASNVVAANRLFATLDPTTRRLRFPKEREITLADTVGFIRNLPNELKEAFQATLEELYCADLLLHVADASHEDLNQQIEAVETILLELGLAEKPRLLLLNKSDRLDSEARLVLKATYPNAIFISGKNAQGLNILMERLEQELFMNKSAIFPEKSGI